MLKTKTITTAKATVLVVELLPKIKPETIKVVEGMMYYHDHIGIDGIAVPKGNWQLLGRLPDITEGQFEKIVEFGDQEPGNDKYILKWKDYEVANVGEECPYMDYSLDTATESSYSLLQANEVYFENPLGDKPDITKTKFKMFGSLYKEYSRLLTEWQEAQSKVWDKERCYLFIKVDYRWSKFIE